MMDQTLIVCEGYDDRAFLKGWLLRRGANDPSKDGKIAVKDPWQRRVQKGQFAFHGGDDRFIRLVPAGGLHEIVET